MLTTRPPQPLYVCESYCRRNVCESVQVYFNRYPMALTIPEKVFHCSLEINKYRLKAATLISKGIVRLTSEYHSISVK